MPTITGVNPERTRLHQYQKPAPKGAIPLAGGENGTSASGGFVLPGSTTRKPTKPSVLAMKAEDLKQKGNKIDFRCTRTCYHAQAAS